MSVVEKPVGLMNMSNSCFFNSVIQVFVNCDVFCNKLLVSFEKLNDTSLLRLLTDLVVSMKKNSNITLIPMRLRTCLATQCSQFNNTEQHDAHEFYLAMISEKEKEDPIEKEIKSLFHGSLLYSYTCSNGHTSKTKEAFCSLSIDLEKDTLGENLQNYFEKQKVQSSCDSFGCKSTDKKCQITIHQFPEYMVIALKRFMFDKKFIKNSKKITINKTLEFSIGGSNNLYILIGCINHTGGLDGGHYTAHVLKQDGWYHCNDSGIFKQNDIYENHVYMAFYKKCNN